MLVVNGLKQTWALTLALVVAASALSSKADAQTALTNGGVAAATIANVAEIDRYRFTAAANTYVVLQVADTSRGDLYPFVVVTSPNGSYVTQCSGEDVALCEFYSTAAGTYSVAVSDYAGVSNGSYNVYLATRGANEGGSLPNGGVVSGAIELGDLDTFTLTSARPYDSVQLRVVDLDGGAFLPRIWLISPSGALESTTYSYYQDTAVLDVSLSVAGAYTVVVSDANLDSNGLAANYKIYYTKQGANEGGALAAGASVTGIIDPGDLDSYSMVLSANQRVLLSLADTERGDLYPRLLVIGTTGNIVADSSGANVAFLDLAAPVGGTYTIVVADGSNDQSGPNASGPYTLYAARMGANEGGSLNATASWSAVDGTIDIGDIDTYTFVARANEGFQIQLTDLSGGAFVPTFYLIGPNGQYFSGASSPYDVASWVSSVSSAGTYTLAVFDGSSTHAAVAPYRLDFARGFGANEGGALASDEFRQGSITKGDLDSFTFTANAGWHIALQVVDTSRNAFWPRTYLYGPAGTLVASFNAPDLSYFDTQVPTTGTYTVIIGDGSPTTSAAGNYDLYFEKAPGTNEGGAVLNGGVIAGTIDRGDLDSFTFTGTKNQWFQLRFVDTSAGPLVPRVQLFNNLGQQVASAQGADVATLGLPLPVAGNYVVKLSDGSSTRANVGTYNLFTARAPGAADDGVLYNGVSRAGTIDKGDIDSFTFTGAVNQVAHIELTKTSVGGTFVPRIYLLDTAGVQLTSTAGSPSSLDFTLPRAGTYSVFVDDGSYVGAGVGGYNILLTGSGATAPL